MTDYEEGILSTCPLLEYLFHTVPRKRDEFLKHFRFFIGTFQMLSFPLDLPLSQVFIVPFSCERD